MGITDVSWTIKQTRLLLDQCWTADGRRLSSIVSIGAMDSLPDHDFGTAFPNFDHGAQLSAHPRTQ